MDLILMRHAPAAKRDPHRYPDDDRRPLTKAGRRTHKKMALALARLAPVPERILASPRLRALQTAQITAEIFRVPVESAPVFGRDYGRRAAAAYLAEQDARVLLCVGHEPDLSDLAGFLLGVPRLRIDFKKSAVIGIRFSGRARPGLGVLRYFYRPCDLPGF